MRAALVFAKSSFRGWETGEPLTGRVEIWYTAERLLDWFVTTKLPIRDRDGEIMGVMGTVRSYEGNRRSLLSYTQIDHGDRSRLWFLRSECLHTTIQETHRQDTA